MQINHETILDQLIPLVDQAGAAIMRIYQQNDHGVEIKDDGSPVTIADLEANKILLNGIRKLWPTIPVISEEGGNLHPKVKNPICYFAIDPLDGTKEFINRNGEFTVNVALIFKGEPILGIVLAPALDYLYIGYSNQNPIFNGHNILYFAAMSPIKTAQKRIAGKWEKITVSSRNLNDPYTPIRIATSRSHPSPELTEWLKKIKNPKIIKIGSSLKFCMLAEGSVDIYPRFGSTSIWDTAAGHAILNSAGGCVLRLNSEKLKYSTNKIKNDFFIALNKLSRP